MVRPRRLRASSTARSTAVAPASGNSGALMRRTPSRSALDVAGSAVDASTPAGAQEVVAAAIERWGRVDAVVANAGQSWATDLLSITPRRSAARCSTALAWRAIDAHEEFARFSPILSIVRTPVSVLDGG